MNDQELRLECLRLANKDADLHTSAELIISKAALFHSFLLNRHLLNSAKTDKDLQEKEGCHEEFDCSEQQHLVVVALTPELRAALSQLQG